MSIKIIVEADRDKHLWAQKEKLDALLKELSPLSKRFGVSVQVIHHARKVVNLSKRFAINRPDVSQKN